MSIIAAPNDSAQLHLGTHEFRLTSSLIVGARAISGLPSLGLAPFAMVWVRWRGVIVMLWDEPVGLA